MSIWPHIKSKPAIGSIKPGVLNFLTVTLDPRRDHRVHNVLLAATIVGIINKLLQTGTFKLTLYKGHGWEKIEYYWSKLSAWKKHFTVRFKTRRGAVNVVSVVYGKQ